MFSRREMQSFHLLKVATLSMKKTHKYDLPLPKLVDNVLVIDRPSGSTLWADAIVKKMKNVRVVFNALEDGRNVHMDSSLSNAT